MAEEKNKPSKAEITGIVDSIFDADIEELNLETLKLIPPKDFFKEVLKQKKARGWRSKIKIPVNWATESANAILSKIEECRLSLTGEQFDELWDQITASGDISVWGSDTWAPKILPNGAVLIRNHHRVISLDERPTGSFDIENTELQKQLVQLSEFFKSNSDSEEAHIDFHFVHRSEEGFDWTTDVPEQLSDYGQTLVFISKSLIEQARESGEFDDDHFIHQESVFDASNESRSGHAVIRVFKHTCFVFGTFRASDEYDSIVENYSYYLGSEPNEGANEQQVSAGHQYIQQRVRSMLEEESEPDLFNEKTLKGKSTLRLLFEEKYYNGYANSKMLQIMEFPPVFGRTATTPSTYYGDEVPFLDYANKFENRLIVIKSSFASLTNVSDAKSELSDKLSSIISEVPGATVKIHMPIPNDAKWDKEEDIFDYESKEYKKRFTEVIKKIKELFDADQKENPAEEGADQNDTEKEWLDSFGYDFEFSILFITPEFPNAYQGHKFALSMSSTLGGNLTLTIPAFGINQGYYDGEYDTGNVFSFLTNAQIDGESDDDDEDEYDDE